MAPAPTTRPMTSPIQSEPRTGHQLYHAATFSHRDAWILTISSICAIYGFQITLVSFGVTDIAATAVGFSVVIAALVLSGRLRGFAAIGLRRPAPRFLLAGFLFGISVWFIALRIVMLVHAPGDTSRIEGVIEKTGLMPTLLVIALMPAIAEEMVFRGVLARALAVRWSTGVAIVASSLLFGAYHLWPPVQMMSTFLLGLGFAFVALQARSAVPSMIAHATNNTIVLLIARREIPALERWITIHPITTLSLCLIALACGLALAAKPGEPAA